MTRTLMWMLLAALLCLPLWSCSQDGNDAEAATDADPAEAVIETLLEPFDPPPLDELDAKATWVDMPVVDGMKRLEEHKRSEPKLATPKEALALRNNSDVDNAKILSALGQLPSTSEEEPDLDAACTRHSPADINTTNPLMISSTYDVRVAGLLGIGLFGFDWEMSPFALADTVVSWQSSEDKLYDKVVLRDDLTWSDGEPITAHDVAYSFRTIMDPRIQIPAIRSGMEKLLWVEAYDDHTLVYFHKESLVTNIWNLNFPIIPQHIYEKTLKEDPSMVKSPEHLRLDRKPVVGGQYTLEKWSKGSEILLKRRESWYMHDGKQVRGKPHFKTIRFRVIEDSNTALLALKSGLIEDMELQPSHWVTQTSGEDFYRLNTRVRGVQWVYYYFGWNTDVPFFEDKRCRQAMSYAMDYDQLLNRLTYGLYEQAAGEFHPTAWMAPKEPRTPYKQDLVKAEALLEAAGWTDSNGDGIRDKLIPETEIDTDDDGKPDTVVPAHRIDFEFNIVCTNERLRIAVCRLLKTSLDRIGVICHVKPLEFPVLLEAMRDHKFQASFGGWGTGTDPDTLENLWKTGEERNYGNYSNPEVDRLFVAGKTEFDPEKRAEIYRRIDDILWEEQGYTWLYFRSAFFGFNKKWRGYTFSPRGPYSYDPGFSAIWAVP